MNVGRSFGLGTQHFWMRVISSFGASGAMTVRSGRWPWYTHTEIRASLATEKQANKQERLWKKGAYMKHYIMLYNKYNFTQFFCFCFVFCLKYAWFTLIFFAKFNIGVLLLLVLSPSGSAATFFFLLSFILQISFKMSITKHVYVLNIYQCPYIVVAVAMHPFHLLVHMKWLQIWKQTN